MHAPLATFLFTLLALFSFAGNSLLCRFALRETTISPMLFMQVRFLSGAIALLIVLRIGNPTQSRAGQPTKIGGNWWAGLALAAYAVSYTYSFTQLTAATGALLLFGAAQVTILTTAAARGERFRGLAWLGYALAMGALLYLVLPGLASPTWVGTVSMLIAGISWGAYTLLGKRDPNPLAANTGNFLRTLPLLAVTLLVPNLLQGWNWPGITAAIVSGVVTTGIGYVLWYQALRSISTTMAAIVLLTVPLWSSLGGILFLSELLTLRFVLAAVVMTIGLLITIYRK
ncbi:MAG: DMT family transporter [Zavarzinella sp.]